MKIGSYIGQLIIVMIGVFAGMIITDWNAQRGKNKAMRNVLTGIKNELIANLEMIEKAEIQRNIFMKSFDSLMAVTSEETLNQKFYDEPI